MIQRPKLSRRKISLKPLGCGFPSSSVSLPNAMISHLIPMKNMAFGIHRELMVRNSSSPLPDHAGSLAPHSHPRARADSRVVSWRSCVANENGVQKTSIIMKLDGPTSRLPMVRRLCEGITTVAGMRSKLTGTCLVLIGRSATLK